MDKNNTYWPEGLKMHLPNVSSSFKRCKVIFQYFGAWHVSVITFAETDVRTISIWHMNMIKFILWSYRISNLLYTIISFLFVYHQKKFSVWKDLRIKLLDMNLDTFRLLKLTFTYILKLNIGNLKGNMYRYL